MRLTVSDLARAFHSLDPLDEASARKRLRLARDLGHDAPLVAWSVTLFVFAGALAAAPEIEHLARAVVGRPVHAQLARQLTTWARPGGGLLAAVRARLDARPCARPARVPPPVRRLWAGPDRPADLCRRRCPLHGVRTHGVGRLSLLPRQTVSTLVGRKARPSTSRGSALSHLLRISA